MPYVTDTDQMLRYLDGTEEGRDLFRWDSLIVPADYTLPFSTTVFRDSVISHRRSVDFGTILEADFGAPVGIQSYCDFRVNDVYTVQTLKRNGAETKDTSERSIMRSGKFVKLGNDNQQYVGWVLWSYAGYSIGNPFHVRTLLKQAGQTAFAVDQDMLTRLLELKAFVDGVTLIISTTSNTPDALREPTVLLSAATDAGFMQRAMKRIDRDHYTDTLKTPTGNTRLWNIIFLQTFHDTEFFFTGGFCIPYRVPQ